MTPLATHVRALLDLPAFAHLAVVTDAGPHVSPVWVDRDGDHILINTAEGRVKTQALRADPRVGLSVTHPQDPYTRVVIQGHVIAMRHDGARDHIDRLSYQYTGEAFHPAPGDGRRVILVIEADRVTS
jgi:PPOX class probable F420-dependent enzyme